MKRRSAALVVLLVVAWLVVAAYGGRAQGTLSEVQQNDDAAFLPDSAESTRAARLAEEFSQGTTLPALVVLRPADGATVTPEDLAEAGDLAARIPELPMPGGGTLADSLTGDVPVVPAEDGRAVMLPVALDGELAEDQVEGAEESLAEVAVAELRGLAAERLQGTGLEAWVTGPAGFVADLVSAFGAIDGILLAVALGVVLLILLVVYRSPFLPFTVLLTAVFGLCAAALVVKPLAEAGTLVLNGQSQGILSILVVGAATDYSLLLVARYREELHRHEAPAAAMRAAWRASWEPVAASAGTVVVGLLCLLLSDLRSNSSLGPVAAIGIVCSVLAALTLLPALLLLPGRRARLVFWPRVPRRPDDPGLRGRHAATRPDLWSRVANLVSIRARPVWAGTALVLLAGAAFVPSLRADGTSESDVFLAEVGSVTGEEVLAEHFQAGAVQPAVVLTSEGTGQQVVDVAGRVEGVGSVRTTSSEGEPLVVDGTVQVEVVTEDAAETLRALETVGRLRTAVQEVAPEALVGGPAAERLDTQAAAARDLRTIVPVVLAAIVVLLALLLRAVLAPLVLLVANVLSFGATMGLSAVVFNHVLDLPGADPTVPLYGFVFLVALGIDYSIFLMTRVREESLVHGTRTGTRRGLAATGGVITSAGLVLAATFSALAVVPLLFLLQIAFIVAVGVLIDTFVVRSLLVPGAVHDLGRRVWWPWRRAVPPD
ncbi:MMPL family transporter [Georgenia alba]|uniref:MMPL family transporter n=1 Tax=Georgenia alba TaxID=2233858 RepID=A0ABW2QBC2_9MICO